MTLRTTVGCDVIHSNFAFGVGVDLHLHRVHFLVYLFIYSVIATEDGKIIEYSRKKKHNKTQSLGTDRLYSKHLRLTRKLIDQIE